jgi:16S rRNA (uracil1498-N3)-methyltransferase
VPSHRFLFYCPEADAGAPSVTLSGDEHHHLARVLRVRPGETVYVTDGRGLLGECRVEDVGGDDASLSVLSWRREEPVPDLALALALIGKERLVRAFEQCVELGATRLIPFAASQSHLGRVGKGTVSRLERVAVSAMKQSFRAHLPVVDPPVDFAALIDVVSRADVAFVGDQHGERLPEARPRGDTVVVVGPEAGLSPDELERLREAGARSVSVSRHRLRAETAAVALVSALAQGD